MQQWGIIINLPLNLAESFFEFISWTIFLASCKHFSRCNSTLFNPPDTTGLNKTYSSTGGVAAIFEEVVAVAGLMATELVVLIVVTIFLRNFTIGSTQKFQNFFEGYDIKTYRWFSTKQSRMHSASLKVDHTPSDGPSYRPQSDL